MPTQQSSPNKQHAFLVSHHRSTQEAKEIEIESDCARKAEAGTSWAPQHKLGDWLSPVSDAVPQKHQGGTREAGFLLAASAYAKGRAGCWASRQTASASRSCPSLYELGHANAAMCCAVLPRLHGA